MHVDEWMLREDSNDYAAWVLLHFRLPAVEKARFDKYISKLRLFCTYEGKRYRVTGASRLGDVWLARDLNQDFGYDKRVDVLACSNWSSEPRGKSGIAK